MISITVQGVPTDEILAVELSSHAHPDLVSVRFPVEPGDVSLVGTMREVRSWIDAADAGLDDLETDRRRARLDALYAATHTHGAD